MQGRTCQGFPPPKPTAAAAAEGLPGRAQPLGRAALTLHKSCQCSQARAHGALAGRGRRAGTPARHCRQREGSLRKRHGSPGRGGSSWAVNQREAFAGRADASHCTAAQRPCHPSHTAPPPAWILGLLAARRWTCKWRRRVAGAPAIRVSWVRAPGWLPHAGDGVRLLRRQWLLQEERPWVAQRRLALAAAAGLVAACCFATAAIAAAGSAAGAAAPRARPRGRRCCSLCCQPVFLHLMLVVRLYRVDSPHHVRHRELSAQRHLGRRVRPCAGGGASQCRLLICRAWQRAIWGSSRWCCHTRLLKPAQGSFAQCPRV